MPVPGHVVHADVVENEQRECADAYPVEVVSPLAKISLNYRLLAHVASRCRADSIDGRPWCDNSPGTSGIWRGASGGKAGAIISGGIGATEKRWSTTKRSVKKNRTPGSRHYPPGFPLSSSNSPKRLAG